MAQKLPKPTPQHIERVYVSLMLLNTLAASCIWGINTIFLLSAGLTNVQAFAANAFFTLGQVLFEVPTGVVADGFGRRTSYLLGTITLSLSTLLYLWAWQIHAPFWVWAGSSILLGLGFSFFSGATEAWLVDALKYTGHKGTLDSVFAKGQIAWGAAMLVGSVGGGFVAQVTNLGVPYMLRAFVLLLTFGVAWVYMKDDGFTPKKGKRLFHSMRDIFTASLEHGWGNPPVRWVMLASPFLVGVNFYAFYAMQPYLLSLYGNSKAYGIAGLAAAILASAQIVGGVIAPHVKHVFLRRTSMLLASVVAGTIALFIMGMLPNFWIVITCLVLWTLVSATATPVRQAYLNGLIPSSERATVLSFDSLIGSTGGIVIQPILGRAADVWSYAPSYVLASAFQIMAAPFIYLAYRQKASSDSLRK